MSTKKVCVVSGTRAEYGLLYPLLKKLKNSEDFELQLVVTGMHLSASFGNSYKEIEKDGFFINKKVEILLSSDSTTATNKAIGLGFIGFAEAFAELNPNVIVVLGDRFEIFAAAATAMTSKIPVVHIAGGESTIGALDDAYRHCISKLSYLHFVQTETYRNRVIQMGENPERVFNVGSIAAENIFNDTLLTKKELEKSLGTTLSDNTIFLITYHPVTLSSKTSSYTFNQLLKALENFPDAKIIFTLPNADPDNASIRELITDFVFKHSHRAKAFENLGRIRYLSLLQFINIVIGNSSSGILEVPFFRKPTINIGDRQKGRIAPDSVIHCEPTVQDISNAIHLGLNDEFKNILKNFNQVYGNGSASEKIMDVLSKFSFNDMPLKEFYDIDFK